MRAGGLTVQVRKRLHSGGREFTLEAAFTVPTGITILFGPSGAGKTTLLDCIAGLVSPEGRITVGDRVFLDTAQHASLAVSRRQVGYVFQDLALFPHLTAEKNIQYGLTHVERRERERRTFSILETFRIVHVHQRRPVEISGGERQRVALARALVTDPCVLLLDEPLAALDAPTKSRILDDLRAWNQAHRIPILYVTHSREEVFALGERVLVLVRPGLDLLALAFAAHAVIDVAHRPGLLADGIAPRWYLIGCATYDVYIGALCYVPILRR